MDADLPPYPVWGIGLPAPVEDARALINRFLAARPNEDWVLIGDSALAGDRQLWTIWSGVTRRRLASSMLSHDVDGEFIRLVAGTHHVSLGFQRAGVAQGDERAWLVHLPRTDDATSIPELDDALDEIASGIISGMDAVQTDARPSPTLEGALHLGILEGDQPAESIDETLFMGHAAGADLQA